MLKMLIGNNMPKAEINVSNEGFVRYTNSDLMALPPNQNTPRTAKEAAEEKADAEKDAKSEATKTENSLKESSAENEIP